MAKQEKKPTLTPKGDKDETVLVSKAELGKVLDRLERLEFAGDKSRLGKFDARFFKRGPNIFTLSVYDEKIITGWRTIKNVSYKDPGSGRLIEDQQYEIIFNDLSKKSVQGYEQFSDIRFQERINVEEVSRTQDENGTTLKVKVINQDSKFYGQEFDIDIKFVN